MAGVCLSIMGKEIIGTDKGIASLKNERVDFNLHLELQKNKRIEHRLLSTLS